jgi:hypothetical protein
MVCVGLLLLIGCRKEGAATPAPTAAGQEERSEAVSPTTQPAGDTAAAGSVFRSNPYGFSFPNYAGRFPEGNLTADQVREMFGDEVCAQIEGDTCVPRPEVSLWIDDMNRKMEGGHCVGFTVAAFQLYDGDLDPAEFAAGSTYEIDQNVAIMQTIAQGYASYYASNVWPETVREKTPAEIVEALLALDEPVDLSIFQPGFRGGHSMLAYDVVDQGEGLYRILVYDNNRPNEENFVVVDTKADTWFYAQGAVNPDEPSGNYQGDAQTKTLEYVPLSAYNQPLACPAQFDFSQAAEASEEGEGFSLISIASQGEVLIETALGKIGSWGGELISDLPGGRLLFPRGELFHRHAPDIYLPAGEAFTLQIQGGDQAEMAAVTIIDREMTLVVDELATEPEQMSQLFVSAADHQTRFTAGGSQAPTFKMTMNMDGADYLFTLGGVDFAGSQSLELGMDEANHLAIAGDGGVANARLIVAQVTEEETAVFASSSLGLSAGETGLLDFAGWDGSGEMGLMVDTDGDGQADREVMLENEPVASLIAGAETAEQIISLLGSATPYLDGPQIAELHTVLLGMGLSGREWGQILFALPELKPSGDALAALVSQMGLSLDDLAQFIVQLNLSEAEINSLLDGLDLSEEERSVVLEKVAALYVVEQLLVEWEFLNSDDPDALAQFLAGLNLSDEQLAYFQLESGGGGHSEPAAAESPAASQGPLDFTYTIQWSLNPDNPGTATAQVTITAVGGGGGYVFYHDELVQPGPTFSYQWASCTANPGSFRVTSADGQSVKKDYFESSPCPAE